VLMSSRGLNVARRLKEGKSRALGKRFYTLCRLREEAGRGGGRRVQPNFISTGKSKGRPKLSELSDGLERGSRILEHMYVGLMGDRKSALQI